MNCRLPCLCIVTATIASSALVAKDELLLDKEKVHTLIREVAAKIESKYKSERPEADGLVQRVEETLNAAAPDPINKSDRPQKLARKMTLLVEDAGFKSKIGGVRGVVFDYSELGYRQRYQDLESATTTDAEEVWRWLEMAAAAKFLKWGSKQELCTQRALGAAHALVSREPKNAEAQALLGAALEWNSEKLAALQTALKLDPRQPLALNELLGRRMDHALETAALHHETRLEDTPASYQSVTKALYDRPLTIEETVAYDRQADELGRDAVRLLSLSEERGDLPTYLKTLNLVIQLKHQQNVVAAAAKRALQESFETFDSRLNGMMLRLMFSMFDDAALLQTALKLADKDPEVIGTIMLMVLIGDSMHAYNEGQRPSESRLETIGLVFSRLVEMAGADESLRAARAAEAAFIIQFGRMALLKQNPENLDQLIRAIHLDPFRQRTQLILRGMCTGAISKDKDLPAAAALSFIELALLPSLQTRRACAGAAARVRDWPTAYRLLDVCLREQPDNAGLLNQKIATLLRESQSKAALKKAEIYFHKMESITKQKDDSDHKLITRNHILFLMLGGKNDEAREELTQSRTGSILDDKECQELEKLLP